MLVVSIALTLIILSIEPVLAQEKSIIAPTHDRAVRELIRSLIGPEYLEEIYIKAAGEGALRFQTQIQPQLKRALSDQEKQRLWLFWHRKVKEIMPYASLEELLLPIVAKYLTLVEVEEITRFYQTPVGKKFASLMPILTREAPGVAEEMVRKFADEKWLKSMGEELKAEFPYWFPMIEQSR